VATGFIHIIIVKSLNATAALYQAILLCRKWGHQTKVLRCDAGSQEMSAVFAEAMAKEGIRIDPAAPNQQNENPAKIYIQQINNLISGG
jgi:hypothetical protein